jgi:ATP-dependent Clp protease adapter protein ClpS
MDDEVIYDLYLYNDNINPFEKVIGTLMRTLDWTVYQAEQCALMAHEKDRTILKSGSYIELRKHSRILKNAGIVTALERKKDT